MKILIITYLGSRVNLEQFWNKLAMILKQSTLLPTILHSTHRQVASFCFSLSPCPHAVLHGGKQPRQQQIELRHGNENTGGTKDAHQTWQTKKAEIHCAQCLAGKENDMSLETSWPSMTQKWDPYI